MLVELLRNKNKLPFDYYKEIILNYRKIINTIDIALVMDYIYALPKAEFVSDALQLKSCNIVNHVHTANTEALTKGVKYMINIAEMIQAENKNGYVQTDQASAKVAQDLILVAISGSSVNKNIAIKGGVVMMNKTQNVRRATRDIDLSFIHYSLSDESINDFVSQLHILGLSSKELGK